MKRQPGSCTQRLAAAVAATLAAASGSLFVGPPSYAAHDHDYLEIHKFAEVPDPGFPEGIAVSDDGIVYVGTHQHILEQPAGVPSKVFAYDA